MVREGDVINGVQVCDTRHLTPQVQQIINKRDNNDKLICNSGKASSAKENSPTYPIAIFMRLGDDKSLNLNGIQTLQVYEEFFNKNKKTWFSTDSLTTGMADKKRAEFNKAIKDGFVVEIYFAVGKNGGGTNEIVYKAEVLDIVSNAEAIGSPDKTLTPNEWKDVKKKIWINIKKLIPFNNLTTTDFLVASTGNVLANSISKSEYHFGYIKRKP